jgi:aminoglycoside 6'-N-acetyltransferase I
MRIRRMTKSDAGDWLRMRTALWPGSETDHAKEIEAFFERGVPTLDAVLLAEDAGSATGFAELSIRLYAEGCHSGRVAYLEGWYVEPHVRRRGIGAALVAAAQHWGREQECTELASDTELGNDGSAAAHRALGFDEVERIICYRKPL